MWPSPTGTEVTNNHLRAIEHSGGYVGGAYDGDRMVGACLAFVGRSRSHDPSVGFHTHLHSHMAAVLPEAADRGIGTAIKLHQRAWALQHEIDRIVWTYDPLVRRNARLNLVKLGGVGVEYLVDFYGQMDDDLNRGEPSDRLLLQWDLATQRVSDALAGTTSALSSDDWIAGGPSPRCSSTREALSSWRRPRRCGSSPPPRTSWRSGTPTRSSRTGGGSTCARSSSR